MEGMERKARLPGWHDCTAANLIPGAKGSKLWCLGPCWLAGHTCHKMAVVVGPPS